MALFKAYDIRGLYPSELNEEIARKIGFCFGKLIGGETYGIGRDMRLSGKSLMDALVDGLMRAGIKVIDLGMVATPMLTFSVVKYGLDAGIMVTASHNPKEYNGFKMVRKGGLPVGWDTGIEELQKMVSKLEAMPKPQPEARVTEKSPLEDYITHLLSFVRGAEGLTVAVDTAHGMAALYAETLFEKLNCKLVPLYLDIDGNFPDHEPNPLKPENMRDLQKAVRETNADIGMEFDGDADRVAFVDEQGTIIPCDLIIALLAKEALSESPGRTVVYDVRSSWAVREEIEALGGEAVMGRVGHSFMKGLLRETNGLLAGELSGHYYFSDNHFADDGAIAAIKVINLLCKQKKPLSELVKPLKRYFASGEVNSDVADKEGKIAELKEKFGSGNITELDGLSVEFDDWWFNVRPSNTEPVLRLTVEAKTEDLMEQKRDDLLCVIRSGS